MYGYTQNKDDYLDRLRRIEGQIRGLQRMVEQDKSCIDILTQLTAATKAPVCVAVARGHGSRAQRGEHWAGRQPVGAGASSEQRR